MGYGLIAVRPVQRGQGVLVYSRLRDGEKHVRQEREQRAPLGSALRRLCSVPATLDAIRLAVSRSLEQNLIGPAPVRQRLQS